MLKKSLIYLLSFLIIGSLLGGFGVWFYGTLSLTKTKGSIEIQGISSSVKIIRDAAGIPHIFASTDQDAFFAYGNGMLPVPGWDGNHEWEGWIPFEELPQDYNPEKGYFATANHKQVSSDYPHLIANYWEPSYRAKRLNQLLLEAVASGSVNLDQMKKIQMDQISSQALEVLPHLRQLQGRNEQERKALKLLHEWNGKLSRDSQIAAIYEAWLHHFERRLFRDDLRDRLFKHMNGRFHPHLVKNVLEIPEQGFLWCDDVRTTPRESCEEQMLEALEEREALMRNYN